MTGSAHPAALTARHCGGWGRSAARRPSSRNWQGTTPHAWPAGSGRAGDNMQHAAERLFATAVQRLPPLPPPPATRPPLPWPASRPIIDISDIDDEGSTLFNINELFCARVQSVAPHLGPCLSAPFRACGACAGLVHGPPAYCDLAPTPGAPPYPPPVHRRPQDARGPARVQPALHRVSSPTCTQSAAADISSHPSRTPQPSAARVAGARHTWRLRMRCPAQSRDAPSARCALPQQADRPLHKLRCVRQHKFQADIQGVWVPTAAWVLAPTQSCRQTQQAGPRTMPEATCCQRPRRKDRSGPAAGLPRRSMPAFLPPLLRLHQNIATSMIRSNIQFASTVAVSGRACPPDIPWVREFVSSATRMIQGWPGQTPTHLPMYVLSGPAGLKCRLTAVCSKAPSMHHSSCLETPTA